MITQELLTRINELARKKRTEGLSPEELDEQKKLYKIYLESIRGQVTNLLESIEVVDATPKKDSIVQKKNFIKQATINLQPVYH